MSPQSILSVLLLTSTQLWHELGYIARARHVSCTAHQEVQESAVILTLHTVSRRDETSATKLHRLLGDTPLLAVRPPLGFDVVRLDRISIEIHTSLVGAPETQSNDGDLTCSAISLSLIHI